MPLSYILHFITSYKITYLKQYDHVLSKLGSKAHAQVVRPHQNQPLDNYRECPVVETPPQQQSLRYIK